MTAPASASLNPARTAAWWKVSAKSGCSTERWCPQSLPQVRTYRVPAGRIVATKRNATSPRTATGVSRRLSSCGGFPTGEVGETAAVEGRGQPSLLLRGNGSRRDQVSVESGWFGHRTLAPGRSSRRPRCGGHEQLPGAVERVVHRGDRLVVLPGQPGVAEVQVDPGRLDVAVPGLGLHRLQRHARFTEPGQTGVPQHVAGHPAEPGAAAGTAEGSRRDPPRTAAGPGGVPSARRTRWPWPFRRDVRR